MRKIITIALVIILLIIPVSALTFRQSDEIDLKHPVRIDDFPSDSIKCNISVFDPENIAIINWQEMNNNYEIHNYTLNTSQTTKLGTYTYDITCTTGNSNKTESFEFEITPHGKETTTGISIFYFGGIAFLSLFIILFTYLFYKQEEIWIRSFSFFAVWGLFLVVNYMAWIGFTNYLPTISFLGTFFKWIFLIQMYASFPLVLISIVFYLYILIMNQQVKHMLEHGVPEDRAYERSVKRGLNSRNW